MTDLSLIHSRAVKRYLMRLARLKDTRQAEASLVCSADDDTGCSQFLMDICLAVIADAWKTPLKALVERKQHLADVRYYDVFPGEHYRLLHSLRRVLSPASIVEVGTYTGMSAAAMLNGMSNSARMTTFDLVDWRQFASHLDEQDFASGKIVQTLEDLSNPTLFNRHSELFRNSQLIFLDGPKSGTFEQQFLANLTQLKPVLPCILVLDDIKFLSMIGVWRAIQSPKLDLTSFGHWSGTGVVDMTAGLKLKH